ncbi:MAG: beta-aspartyl-peptidase [Clostridium sp.]|nr:beta-aspartyl-peptidase [Clostridium sp.]
MITVIENIKVYNPKYLGIKTIVLAGEKIEGIYDKVNVPKDFISIEIIDGRGKSCLPGFIDSHVHIIGGGGEGGFRTRIPEINIKTLIESGITSVVGCLGTDSVCRNMETLLAKVNSLDEEGITAYCYTGSYDIPVKTLTDSIKKDVMLIEKIIGVGEIALSDHRSTQPTYDEFVRAISETRVGGLLSGKSGIVNIHLGDGKKRLDYLFRMLEETEIPLTQVLPTHLNRNKDLLSEGLRYAKNGGNIDLTTSSDPEHLEPGEMRASEALSYLLNKGISIENITFSSDGNGSMPMFDKGKLLGIGICSVQSLYNEVTEAVKKYSIPMEEAIKVITSNVAEILKLKNKGTVEAGKDADLVIIDDKDLKINTVIAKGKIVVKEGKSVIESIFA